MMVVVDARGGFGPGPGELDGAGDRPMMDVAGGCGAVDPMVETEPAVAVGTAPVVPALPVVSLLAAVAEFELSTADPAVPVVVVLLTLVDAAPVTVGAGAPPP